MLATTTVDWTQVFIVGVPAIIAAICSGVAVIISANNSRALKTPSGDSIGKVAERTHDLSALSVAAATGSTGPVVDKARERLNGGPGAPLVTPEHHPGEHAGHG